MALGHSLKLRRQLAQSPLERLFGIGPPETATHYGELLPQEPRVHLFQLVGLHLAIDLILDPPIHQQDR